jgi:hypothetical protein
MTCSSGNQKLLAVDPTATQGGSTSLHGISGHQWIPPIVLYKRKYRREVSGDVLSAGSTFSKTPKGYIT